MGIFVFLVCILNVGLWIIFLTKFKNLFSVKNVLKKGREELDRMIMDLNNNADRDITLANDRINNLRRLIADADKQIKILESIEEKNAALMQFKNEVSSINLKNTYADEQKSYTDLKTKDKSVQKNRVGPDSIVKLKSYDDAQKDVDGQPMLFDLSENEKKSKPATINVRPDGSSYAKIPVVSPKSFVSEKKTSFSNADIKAKIVTLFDSGFSAEDIASRLGCSITEVQFVLALASRV